MVDFERNFLRARLPESLRASLIWINQESCLAASRDPRELLPGCFDGFGGNSFAIS